MFQPYTSLLHAQVHSLVQLVTHAFKAWHRLATGVTQPALQPSPAGSGQHQRPGCRAAPQSSGASSRGSGQHVTGASAPLRRQQLLLEGCFGHWWLAAGRSQQLREQQQEAWQALKGHLMLAGVVAAKSGEAQVAQQQRQQLLPSPGGEAAAADAAGRVAVAFWSEPPVLGLRAAHDAWRHRCLALCLRGWRHQAALRRQLGVGAVAGAARAAPPPPVPTPSCSELRKGGALRGEALRGDDTLRAARDQRHAARGGCLLEGEASLWVEGAGAAGGGPAGAL